MSQRGLRLDYVRMTIGNRTVRRRRVDTRVFRANLTTNSDTLAALDLRPILGG